MRRRSALWAVLIVLVAVGVVGAGLGYFLKQVPEFYASPDLKAQPDDEKVANDVLTRIGDSRTDVLAKPDWGIVFSDKELNAFFREYLDDGEEYAEYLNSAGFHNVRTVIDGDRILLAARYGDGAVSTVFSVELRVWLVTKEVNTVALEVCGVKAGALPFETQILMDWISDAAREWNIEATWYRHDGHPTGLFRFYADQPRPTTQIRGVKVADGKLSVTGRSQLDMRLPTPPPNP